jgi:hypothetical protein
VFARLQFDRKIPLVWVPLSPEQVAPFAKGMQTNTSQGWTSITLETVAHIAQLGELFRTAYIAVKQSRS